MLSSSDESAVEAGVVLGIYSRTRYGRRHHHFAQRQTTEAYDSLTNNTTTSSHIAPLPPQHSPSTMVLNTDPNGTFQQSQPTTDHSLNDLQDRKRAPFKKISLEALRIRSSVEKTV